MEYDLDLEPQPKAPKRPSYGCAFGGWLILIALTAFALMIGYRTYFYYQKIRSGEIVDLPQFNDRLTVSGNQVIGAEIVDRSEVERENAPSFGPDAADAKLVIVQFADYQCPYSKDEAEVVRRMMQKYKDQVRFEFRDYPIEEIHQEAVQAAVAGRCAQEQAKFWPYHDKMFASSPSLTYAELLAMAGEVGMDTRQFERCMLDGRFRTGPDAVDIDINRAKSLGVSGTPTFFFNGRRIDGAIPEDVFEDVIQKMLNAK